MGQQFRVPDPDRPGQTILVEAIPGGGYREVVTEAPAVPLTVPLGPRDPYKVRADQRAEASANRQALASERSAEAANRQAGAAERTAANQDYNNAFQLRSQFDGLPPVKEYRVAISQLATGLKTAPNATGDNALIYAYAKTMDPGSVVRESEMGMAASGQSVFDSVATNLKKQFGIAGGGQLSPEIRTRLRREMLNKGTELNRIYNAQRQRFIQDAKAFGFDPKRIVGDHDGDPYRPILREYGKSLRQVDKPVSSAIDDMVRSGRPFEEANAFVTSKGGTPLDPNEYSRAVEHHRANPGYKGSYGAAVSGAPVDVTDAAKADTPADYDQSPASQGLSGINEGLASVAGAPVDLVTGAINLVPRGINALANTDIPTINDPVLGSQWIKRQLGALGSIGPAPATPAGQTVRRVGESIGAAAVPAGFAGSLARGGAQLLAGAGGGAGAAAAQRIFPGNPIAEVAGEVAGGGLTGAGLIGVARRNATRQMEDQIPTIPQLKEQAGDLYRQAESRGVVADPVATQGLADTLRRALAEEGSVSPTGRISEVYPKAKEAMQLADDYAGQTMTPTQIQTVRKVVADGLSSPDRTDRRLGGILTDAFDEWANPLAPELSEARDVASRYLTAEQLEQARELAGARAGQFSGSGYENALRTEYRGLDRGAIKGNKRFSDDVTGAIETVSRGTPASNFARGLGKLAPRGVVSFGLGTGAPAMVGTMVAGPAAGAALGGTALALGEAGRAVATQMGLRSAKRAELIARNGGALPKVQMMTPEAMQAMNALVAAELAKYLPQTQVEKPANKAPRYHLPHPLPR